jgi:GH24 family phage-related lysozyme (muramidase)
MNISQEGISLIKKFEGCETRLIRRREAESLMFQNKEWYEV